jgi:dsRNA-specific ribonuclease
MLTLRPLFATLQHLKHMMVSNNTLSHISRKIGIFAAVKMATPGATSEDQTIAADSFEAYVGAVFQECRGKGDFSTLENWFASIFNVNVFPEMVRIGEARNAGLWGKTAKRARDKKENCQMGCEKSQQGRTIGGEARAT